VSGQSVRSRVNGEGDVWEGVQVGAVSADLDTVNQWVNDGLWSNKKGGSGVNDSLVLGGINLLGSLSDLGEVESPVFLLNNLVGINCVVKLIVHTWDGHVALLLSIMEIE